ncbi:hypothetical protein EON80_17915, partial [bacterium]
HRLARESEGFFVLEHERGIDTGHQATGVEGYVDSAAAGLMAGINAALVLKDEEPLAFPRETVLGSLAHYITSADAKHFQPMNSNWALLPPLAPRENGKKWKKDEKAPIYVERGQAAMEQLLSGVNAQSVV